MYMESAVIAVALMVSLFLLILALVALFRARTGRMFLVALGFGMFMLRNAVLTVYLFTGMLEVPTLLILMAGIDTLGLLSLYIGVLKR